VFLPWFPKAAGSAIQRPGGSGTNTVRSASSSANPKEN